MALDFKAINQVALVHLVSRKGDQMTTRYLVKLTGEMSPMLLHRDNLEFSEKYLDAWRNAPRGQHKKSVAGDDRSPAWSWIQCLYDEFGKVVIPADNLMTMLREGGVRCPTGKGKQTFKALTQSGIMVDDSSWPLLVDGKEILMEPINALIGEEDFAVHDAAVRKMGFELFVKRARIGQNKHVRVRPRFDRWECTGSLTILDNAIKREDLENILTFAGQYAGLGDWRPSSPKAPGYFGKFSAWIERMET